MALDPQCLVTLNVGDGPDRPIVGESMRIHRLNRGDNGEMEISTKSRSVPLTFPHSTVSLEQDTEYVFIYSGGRFYRKTPAASTANFGPPGAEGSLIEYIPAPDPGNGVLGDGVTKAIFEDDGSETRAVTDALYVGVGDVGTAAAADASDFATAAQGLLADGAVQSADLDDDVTALLPASDLRTGLDALYQPLDSDLTAIAALSTTSFGRALLEAVNAASSYMGDLRGTGQPNSSVTAPQGSYYTDTSQTAGARRWYKASGSGNTGWVIAEGDTGWRTIVSWTSGVQDGASQLGTLNAAHTLTGSGVIQIRRINHDVLLNFPNLSGDTITLASGINDLFTANSLPAGWRFNGTFSGPLSLTVSPYAGSVSKESLSATSGALRINLTASASAQRASATWKTNDAWPSSLPGVAA